MTKDKKSILFLLALFFFVIPCLLTWLFESAVFIELSLFVLMILLGIFAWKNPTKYI